MTAGTLLASRYELVRQLGRGGMGHVWLATDRVLGREVAVKTVDLAAHPDPAAAERFRREAKAAAALSHDHVVTIFDSGTDGSTAYLVMQRLPGPTLEAVIRDRGALPIGESLDYAEQTASALAATHRLGIVHRDIKPGNLMLDDQGRLQVVDFGIARLTESASAQLTAASTVVGSAPFMAPEQAEGRQATPATDLYALGCVLLTMLTGRPPFEAEHPLGALQQHLTAPPPRASDRRPGIPPAVDGLVERLLAKDPADRPADADEVSAELRGLRTAIDGSSSAVGPGAPVASTLVLPAAIDAQDAVATQVLAGGGAGVAPAPAGADAVATRVLADDAAGATRVLPPAVGASPQRARRRLGRPVLAVVAGVALLILLALVLPPLLAGLGGSGGQGEPAASEPATTPAETVAPPAEPEPSAPAPAEPAPAELTPALTLAQLRAAVDVVQPQAGEDERRSARAALLERVDDLERRLADGRTQDMANKLEDLAEELDELEEEGRLPSADAAAIRSALDQLERSLG